MRALPIITFMSLLERATAQAGLDKGLELKSTSATKAVAYRFLSSHVTSITF